MIYIFFQVAWQLRGDFFWKKQTNSVQVVGKNVNMNFEYFVLYIFFEK